MRRTEFVTPWIRMRGQEANIREEMKRLIVMQRAVLLLCWLPLLNHCHAVNPGCSCVVYSSSDRPQGGTFTSPDFPKRYPPNIDCLLYTFIGHQDEIVVLNFHHFNVRRTWPE
ncbi:PREDICTED: uncharacterized protein LOC105560432 [Vollenhovia emeryi]|uniref:uncharacterized protein LOC105560432 n=1 Tax=Vollenhovia emeryi TaxID=411798 RepID=UPI0005F3B63D|nr:PREDICTED: uncharacterized protein LOC105560432 [Vollenhovia emeryi]